MVGFECCHKCKAPKRHPGCHSHCPDYKEERAAYDEKMNKVKQERRLSNAINAETGRQVDGANRRKRKHWGGA